MRRTNELKHISEGVERREQDRSVEVTVGMMRVWCSEGVME